jgi:hypothetical protein
MREGPSEPSRCGGEQGRVRQTGSVAAEKKNESESPFRLSKRVKRYQNGSLSEGWGQVQTGLR